jgi:hypothetical protein
MNSKVLMLGYGLALGIMVALVTGGLFLWRNRKQFDQRVLAWAAQQPLEPGATAAIPLPQPLRVASRESQVHVARLHDHNTCILLKKKVGYKGNFKGTLCCTRLLSTSEIIEDKAGGRSYVSLFGHGIFEELYIRRRVSSDTMTVYFDLY